MFSWTRQTHTPAFHYSYKEMSLFPKIANMLESPSRCRGRVHSQRHSTLALAKNEVGTLLEQRVNSELFRRRRSFFGFGSENKEDRGSGKTVQLSSAPTRFVAWNIQPPTHFHQRARRFPPTDRKTLINIHDMMRHKRRNAHAHTHTHTIRHLHAKLFRGYK